MDMQKILDNAMVASRQKELQTSSQLLLGELVLKLEAIKNKKLPIKFDYKNYKPTGLDSWRGSYCELAIQYSDKQARKDMSGSNCYDQPKSDCQKDSFGNHHYECKCGGTKKYNTALPKNPTVKDLLKVLRLVIGKFFTGYKGGDFTMGKNTPIWIANYGESNGFERKKDVYNTYIVDVKENRTNVVLITKDENY